MEKKLKDNLRMIFAVKHICKQYESVWINDPDFVMAYTELEESTMGIDHYLEDDIHPKMLEQVLVNVDLERAETTLNYKLDKGAFKFKRLNKEFYQAYFRAKVLVKHGFITEAEIGSNSYNNSNFISKTA